GTAWFHQPRWWAHDQPSPQPNLFRQIPRHGYPERGPRATRAIAADDPGRARSDSFNVGGAVRPAGRADGSADGSVHGAARRRGGLGGVRTRRSGSAGVGGVSLGPAIGYSARRPVRKSGGPQYRDSVAVAAVHHRERHAAVGSASSHAARA